MQGSISKLLSVSKDAIKEVIEKGNKSKKGKKL